MQKLTVLNNEQSDSHKQNSLPGCSSGSSCNIPEADSDNEYFQLDETKGKKTEKFIIVESGRCSWARCTFCSFSKKPAEMIPKKSVDEIKKEIDNKLKNVTPNSLHLLKFFNSGSFFDENQIPLEAQKYLVDKCKSLGIKELLVESTNEWVIEENLKRMKKWVDDGKEKLQVKFGFGFETFDNEIRKKIRKIGTAEDYINAAKMVKSFGFKVRFYVMVGLPFVSDYRKDLTNTIKKTYDLVDEYAIINTFPYGYSVMFDWYMKQKWKPLTVQEFMEIVLPVKKKFDKKMKMELYPDDYVTYPKFPEYRQNIATKNILQGAKIENLENPFYYVWQDYLQRFYHPPEEKQVVLFLPCSFQKPYSKSKTHKAILSRLIGLKNYPKVHQVMISNPGIIPREHEGKWPFNSYDWPEWEETPALKKKYVELTEKRVFDYLRYHKKQYKKVFCFFKQESESLKALRSACKKLKIKLIECMDKNEYDLLSRRNLDTLTKVLRDNL